MTSITTYLHAATVEILDGMVIADSGTATALASGPTVVAAGVTVGVTPAGSTPTVAAIGTDVATRVGATAVALGDVVVAESGGTGRVVPSSGVAGEWLVGVCTQAGAANGWCSVRALGIPSSASSTRWELSGGEYVELAYNDAGEAQFRVDGGAEGSYGSPAHPAELVWGEGDSRAEELLCYTHTASVWSADLGDTIRAGTGVTPGTSVGDAIYFAADLEVGGSPYLTTGFKVAVLSAMVLGSGAYVCEINTASGWTEINHMSTLSGAPYTPYANALLQRVQSEQLRLDMDAIGSSVASDPMSHGGNRHWIRFRVDTAAITTAPTFGVVKYHTSRGEGNGDGVREMFGAAQTRRDLGLHVSDFDRGSSVLGSTDIVFGPNITVGSSTAPQSHRQAPQDSASP